MHVTVGLLGAASLGLARLRRWLTPDGILAALGVGAVVWLASGGAGLLLLLLFFVGTSLLTGVSARRRGFTAVEQRGRSARQVVANGGVAAVCALLAAAGVVGAGAALAGAVAAAAADSWATEVGTAVAGPTRLLDGRRVPPGRTGGLSVAGSVAAVAGAGVVGAAAAELGRAGLFPPTELLPVLVGGVGGMLFDSVLGTWWEGRLRWANNETVNVAATAAGAALAVILA